MEKFKREIWEKDELHIEYDSLDYQQIQQILYKIVKEYNVTIDNLNNSSFFINMSDILKKSVVLLDINEKDGFKDMCSLLKLNILQNSIVYVIWNYTDIDRFQACTLQKYWDYIWYGTSDEVCLLYFADIKSFVMINDYGTIQIEEIDK